MVSTLPLYTRECMRLCMRLCVNNRTADEAVYEQHDCAWGHVWTSMLCMWNKWKFKGKMERCNRIMMTKRNKERKLSVLYTPPPVRSDSDRTHQTPIGFWVVQPQSDHSPSSVRAKSKQSPSKVWAKSKQSPSKVQAKSKLSPIRVRSESELKTDSLQNSLS